MTTHIISALITKRAELAGEIKTAEAVTSRLRESLLHLDATLAIFDPTVQASTIPARVKRIKPYGFKHGHFRRTLLGILREANGPMSAKDVAERLIADGNSSRALPDLVHKVRGTFRRTPEGLERGIDRFGSLTWRLVLDGEKG
jgi:hypothetical protein